MATYLQGVEAYIPQIQPFQEDLNQYASMLGTKQQQYDSNYKKLNQVYGSYFYADLSRESNLERRDEIIKNIDFNLKRVSGLDLSLEQNVTQAMQVFKPFYEDKYMMKDMAWTKNFNNQKSIAQGYLNSKDEETRSLYWDTGTRALDYLREEFRELSDDESLGMGNAQYTPYVNSVKKAMEIAKEAGLNVEKIDFSPDGKWIIKTKNGEALMEPLNKLFEATLGNDPAIQKVYQTQAYVNRKDFAYSNAGMFGGDKNAAEIQYLENAYNMLKQESQMQYQLVQQENATYDTKIKDMEAKIKAGTADPNALKYLESLKMNKQVSDQTLAAYRKQAEQFEEYSGTSSTSNKIPYGSIENLRYKVDSAMAAKLMQKDMGEAAQIFAYRNQSIDIDANPYAVNEQKHAFSMQEIAARNAGLANVARIKAAADLEKQYRDQMYDAGLGTYDPVTKEFKLLDQGVMAKVSGDATTPSLNIKQEVYKQNIDNARDLLIPKLQAYDNALQELLDEGKIKPEKVKELLGGMDLDTFRKNYQKDPDKFARYYKTPNGKSFDDVVGNLKNYFGYNAQGNINVLSTENKNALNIADEGFQDYMTYKKDSQEWMIKSAKLVEQELYNKGFKYAKYLYTPDGRLRTEKEFYSMIPEKERLKYQNAFKGSTSGGVSGVGPIGKLNYEYDSQGNIIKTGKASESENNNYKKALSYHDMVKAAASSYSDNKMWTGKMTPPVGLHALGGGGTGVAGRVNVIDFNPSGSIGTESGQLAFSVFGDLRQMDIMSDKVDLSISGFGTKDSKLTEREDKLFVNQILEGIMSEASNHKTKIGNIGITGSAVAQASTDREAVVITPSQKYLANLAKIYAEDADKLAIINSIVSNGISVIGDRGSFNTPLVKGIRMTPLENNVNYAIANGRTYKIEDPMTGSIMEIGANKAGTSNFTYKYNINVWDPIKMDYTPSDMSETMQYSNLLPDDARRGFLDYIRYNIEPYNREQFNISLNQ